MKRPTALTLLPLLAGICALTLTAPAAAASTSVDGAGASSADEPLAAVVVDDDGGARIVDVPVPAGQSVQAAADAFSKQPGVVAVSAPVPMKAAATGDPYRTYQWGLDATGFPAAWGKSTGAGQVVAVVDTGVDASHPDLAGKIVEGINLTNDDGLLSRSQTQDEIGHGTHIAGIISAIKGNGIGIAGAAPDAKVMPVKVFEPDGTAWSDNVAAGIVLAADKGATVINLSLGGTVDDPVLAFAVNYARARGVTVVAAAGNERKNGNQPQYPAAYDGVIAVAALNKGDNLEAAPFSNIGEYIDLAAPGVQIASTYPGGKIVSMDGTSGAAAHVAAAAALLRSQHPNWSADAVENAIIRTVRDVYTYNFDEFTGHGLLQADAATSYTQQFVRQLRAGETTRVKTGASPNSIVFGNLTAVQPSASGWLMAHSCGESPRSPVSNLNFAAGRNTANYLAVKTDSNGEFCVYASVDTHVLFDQSMSTVRGWWVKPPKRIFDSRLPEYGARKVKAGSVVEVYVEPNTTVLGNLTAVQPSTSGWMVAYPCGTPRPTASNVNFTPGNNTANYLAVKTSANGTFCVYTTADTHILFDHTMSTQDLDAKVPVRALDTRLAKFGGAKVKAGSVVKVYSGASGNSVAFGNLTAVQPSTSGWMVAYPCESPRPLASNVNFVAGENRANYMAVKTGTGGTFCVYTTADTHILFDYTMQDNRIMDAHSPVRKLDTRVTGPYPNS